MQRTLSEEKVLKQLGINSFREMSKDKIMEFSSMITDMEPEVAIKALEQFPNFMELSTSVISTVKDTLQTLIKGNDENEKEQLKMCSTVIDALQSELSLENISSEERARIESELLSVLSIIRDMNVENKKFRRETITKILSFGGMIIAIGASLIGANIVIKKDID